MLYVFIDILQPISSGCDQLVQVVYFTLAIMPFLDLDFVTNVSNRSLGPGQLHH